MHGQPHIKEMHVEFLRLLRDAFRSKTKQFVSPSREGPAQRSVLVEDILTKDNVTTLEFLPCSPNLVAADCYVVPRLKSAL